MNRTSASPGGGEQLGLEGMPRRLYTCTPTRLSTWLDCPRRYRMSYLDRPPPPKGPPWAHNSLGASVHTALASWWRLPLSQRTVTAAGDLLERGWIDLGYADEAQSLRHRDRARRMVEDYVGGLDPAVEPVGVERTVATRTERIAVSGRVDRLDERPAADGGTELVVVDYKTGRHLLTVDDARTSLPLALYALAAERVMRRPCRRVELHHLPTGTVLAWEHTAQTLARQLGRAEDIAAECAAADEQYRAGLAAGRDGPGLPAAAGFVVRLVRLPAALSGGPGRRRASQALGRDRTRRNRAYRLASSAAFQNLFSALAVVSGASTAGECVAPGMHTRCARSRSAIFS